MSKGAQLQARAVDIIGRLGSSMTLVERVATRNPGLGTVSFVTTNHAVTASPPAPLRKALVDAGLGRAGDMTVVYAGDIAPQIGWGLTHGGRTFTLVSVSRYDLTDEVVAWELVVRGE